MAEPHRTSIVGRASAYESWLSGHLQDSLRAAFEITALALAAHVFADGHVPGVTYALGFSALVLAGCVAQADRRERLPMVVLAVLAAPVGLHLLLPAAPMEVHAGMPGMGTVDSGTLDLTPPMIWAHLIGALLTAIVLLGQDFVWDLLLAWWRRRPETAAVPLARVALNRQSRAFSERGLLAFSPRRGPPPPFTATP